MTKRIALALSLSLAGISGARADEPAPPPPADPLVKMTIIALPHPGVPEDISVSVLRSVEIGIKENKRLEYKDLDSRIADISADTPADELEAARGAFTEGKTALEGGDAATAATKLDTAVKGLAKVLPFIKKSELADAMAFLAVADAENGDKAAARRQFARLLTWRGDYNYDVTVLPPKYLSLFEEAQKDVDKLKHGTLQITSVPDGAAVYVDGKFYKVTPCPAGDLIAGEHFITLKKEGYRKAVQSAIVNPKKEQLVTIELQRNDKSLLIEQAVAQIDRVAGAEIATPDMQVIKDVLYIDQVVFARVADKGPADVEVKVWLYDLRTKRRLSQVEKVVARKDLETQLAPIAQQLYLNVNYSGELEAPKEKELPKQVVRPPLYKTWYFWAGVAAAVLVVAAVGIGVKVGSAASCQDGMLCPTFHQ